MNNIGETLDNRAAALQNLQKGTYGTEGEFIRTTKYDTIALTSGTTEYNFFQVPIGGTKHKGYTNHVLAGAMTSAEKMYVQAISVSMFISGEATTSVNLIKEIDDFMFNTILDFLVYGKESVLTIPLNVLIGVPLAVGGDSNEYNTRLRNTAFMGMFQCVPNIELAANTAFSVRLQTFMNSTNLSTLATQSGLIRVSLVGLIARLS